MWKDYVEEYFDNVAYTVKKESDSREEAMEQYGPNSFVGIRDAFLDTIDQIMVSVSDYIIAYGIQLHKPVLLLKGAIFINEGNNTIVLEEEYGVNVQEILPEDFLVLANIEHFPPPLNTDCTPTVALKNRQSTLLKRDMMADESIEPYLTKMALNKYMISFKNLWSNKFRYTRLLNRVIIVLLRIHLAPKRERFKRENVKTCSAIDPEISHGEANEWDDSDVRRNNQAKLST
ncbi:hypothetical protein BCV72DRAFT_334526 [Rhizopus microsporus var. microsporus]|uniref:Uncharacterized protein n=1 Tax=Rhizopus microsporus var. microsporus TaxID=86635 RepID=A0A1X0R8G7_RHIZD|nr:hypothetical protein BCV72DRAFT_334526 [Rhizopus microsporus var. microsporus]